MSRPGPWAGIRPARDAARHAARSELATGHGGGGGGVGMLSGVEFGPWQITINESGDLVAVHDTGTVRVLATLDTEGEL